ncbi:MAG: hypothetical protein NTY77_07060 [Elusimicrobia bacterium]|nr:hypothetical protein [Elusimicrobiota bacterium]
MRPERPLADAAPPAILAALGLWAFTFLDRLPAAADYVVPRRPGWALYRLALAAAGGPAGRLFSVAALLLLAAAFFLVARRLWLALDWRRNRDRLKSAPAVLGLLAGAGGLLWAARFASAVWFDLLLNAWFAPGGADLREPILAALGVVWLVFFLSAALFALGRAAAGRGWGELWRSAGCAAAFLAPALGLHVWAAARCDAGARSLAQAAGIPREPSGRETVLILTAPQGRADFEVYDAATGIAGTADLSGPSLRRLEGWLAQRPLSVWGGQARRLLWEGYARRQDVGRLRSSLWAAERGGDALAWFILTRHLAAAPPDALSAGLLDSLADERRWRIGGRAALLLAQAYAHLGLAGPAAAWNARAGEALGLAPGLAAPLPVAGALRPGAIRGSIRGLRRARVALYARRGLEEPYALGPERLVASAWADGGRFRFSGLSAGDYYLSLSAPAAELPARREAVAVRGHRGDISLSARRPSAEVSLIVSGGAKP